MNSINTHVTVSQHSSAARFLVDGFELRNILIHIDLIFYYSTILDFGFV